MSFVRKPAIFAGTLLAATLGVGAANAAGVSLKMASLAAGSPSATFSIAVIKLLKEKLRYNVQLQTGQPATRQELDAANGDLDLFVSAAIVHQMMRDQKGQFKGVENASELYGNIRGMLGYPNGIYQMVTWADTGITSLEEIKGKRVFTGPPGGAARTTSRRSIKGATGFEPGEDYTEVNLDWSSAQQAFQDRQIDVYIVPTAVPSPQIKQLSLLGKIRLLSVPESALQSPEMQANLEIPGRAMFEIAPDTYGDQQVNTEPVFGLASMGGMATNKWLPEEVGYNITKTVFENQSELVAAAQWMKIITLDHALDGMIVPLHVGTYKYYKERGMEVPEQLIPPEAK